MCSATCRKKKTGNSNCNISQSKVLSKQSLENQKQAPCTILRRRCPTLGLLWGKAELEMPAPTPDRQKNIEKPLDLPVVFPFHRQPWRKTFAATSCSRDVLLSKYENLIVSVCYSMDDQFGSMTYLFTMVTFHCKLFFYEREHLRSTKRVPESIHLHK